MSKTSWYEVEQFDEVHALGIVAVIDKVLYQFCNSDYAIIEFIDDKGQYRHYKSVFDGGKVVQCFCGFGAPVEHVYKAE